MSKHQFNLTIEAKTDKEADEKVAALTTLASKLTVKELSKLAYIVRHDPVKTAMAKKYLGV